MTTEAGINPLENRLLNNVFISYCWDNIDHENKVLSFTDFLRRKGFHAQIDKFLSQEETSIDFIRMMHLAVTNYKKVIIVLSKGYKERSEQFKGGVGEEYSLIIKDIKNNPRKYILVSFEGILDEIVPIGLQGREIIDLSDPEKKEILFAKLLDRNLYEFSPVADSQPEIQPKAIIPYENIENKKVLPAYDIEIRKKEIENSIIDNDLINATKLFISFVNDFDSLDKFLSVKVIIGSRSNSLESTKPDQSQGTEYAKYIHERSLIYKDILSSLNELYQSGKVEYGKVESIQAEGNRLFALFQKDIIQYYPLLVAFSDRYSGKSSIKNEVILLGSQIMEIGDNKSILTTTGSNFDFIIKKTKQIIDDILLTSSSIRDTRVIKDNEKIKNHFLEKSPLEKSVFICERMSKKISKTFSINDISLNLKLGEITAIVGENGNGKSSLLKLIAGELKPSQGYFDYPLFKALGMNWGEMKSAIGYVQEQILYPGRFKSIRELLQFSAAVKGILGTENRRQLDLIIALLGLEKHQFKSWKQLSGGYKLRAEIASKLIGKPRLLVLDEPLANLDIKVQVLLLKDLINFKNSITYSMTVILSSQNIYEIEKVADNIIFLKEGRQIYSGESKNLGEFNNFRCYHLGIEKSKMGLETVFSQLNIIELRRDDPYTLVFTSPDTSMSDIFRALSAYNITTYYLRDISNSARLLFDK